MSKEDNPWKTLSSKVIYSNPWISVREDSVIRPDGEPGIYGVVDCRVATGVVALTPEREVYLVGQYRYPLDLYSWEIIEGGAETIEDPLLTAQRELQEEAGLTARKWQQLGGVVHLSNCYSSEVAYLYLAMDLEKGVSNPDGTEVLQIKKVPLSKALEMVYEAEITDAMSIIGLLRAAQILKSDALTLEVNK